MLGPPPSAAGPSHSGEKGLNSLNAAPKPNGEMHSHLDTNVQDTTAFPSPVPQFQEQRTFTEWDSVLKSFLRSAGLTQALYGFELDMLVMSPDWEQSRVPSALEELSGNLLRLREHHSSQVSTEGRIVERPLDERKLEHTRFAPGIESRTPSTITKSISQFLAQSRARNNMSNHSEFLLSLADKRRRLNESGDYATRDEITSCARTDAKTQNRDLQMKYDIAKNEDGPLRKTLRSAAPAPSSQRQTPAVSAIAQTSSTEPTAERYPAFDERVKNVETHLAVRYAPSPPRSLLDRLKYLEDHIIKLEKEYPPWAALHFNQPNRGWPPPPRQTPIIVPPHLRSIAPPELPSASTDVTGSGQATSSASSEGGTSKGKGKQGRAKSSLHRAVMEKLEVQKAMEDLAGLTKE